MVFRSTPRETIELLRSILQKLEQEIPAESGDLAYLRRIILDRIAELEAARRFESSKAEPPTHREAA